MTVGICTGKRQHREPRRRRGWPRGRPGSVVSSPHWFSSRICTRTGIVMVVR